ncbi:DUF6332 family protein [Streptomyces sp. NPDC090442]|uniref:DUF6332 family protein n=1 Tax=Streptomyces sp. NPDC090442 TaxID=3365962 RepID=UPI0037FCBAA9
MFGARRDEVTFRQPAAVFAVALVPALVVGVAEPAGKGLLAAGGVLAVTAAVWRVVRVLRRFDASRRQGR